jgi:type IV pilus assembly protein PilB
MDRIQKLLGEIFVEKGIINSEQLKVALEEQRTSKEFLGTILIRKNQIKEEDLLQALSEQFNVPFVRIKDKYIDWDLVKKFSSSLILDYKCFPVEKDDLTVTIAITNPLDMWALQKCEEESRPSRLKLVLATQSDIQEAIERYQQYMRGNISKM